jgi:hypothetical protein
MPARTVTSMPTRKDQAEPPKRVVTYERVSSKEQEKEGYSIPAQERLLREYALQHGLVIAEEFVDVETAKRSGRTGFTSMLEYLKKHRVTCRTILVETTSVPQPKGLDDAGRSRGHDSSRQRGTHHWPRFALFGPLGAGASTMNVGTVCQRLALRLTCGASGMHNSICVRVIPLLARNGRLPKPDFWNSSRSLVVGLRRPRTGFGSVEVPCLREL